MKDFVARVGKAYEKTTESSEESEVMAKKVRCRPTGRGRGGGWGGQGMCFMSVSPT